MERNTNAKGGFWMLVEELYPEPIKEANESVGGKREVRDDEFYPDASI
jgi:hypothetical protein